MSPIIQEILRIARELLNVPTIVCMAACLIGLIVAIIYKFVGHNHDDVWILCLCIPFTILIFGVITAIIAMLFFHVPFAKIVSVANTVLLVLLPFFSIILIFFAPEIMEDGKAGGVRDKYNLWKPGILCKTVVFISAILGLIFVVATFLVALIAEWFFKVEAAQAGSARDIRLFWIAAFNIVLFISCLIIDLIRMGIYKVKLHRISMREKAAHTSFDPIMLEAIDTLGRVDKSQIKRYCEEKHIKKYQDFLAFSFFITEGLSNYIKANKIKVINTHKDLILYETTNQSKRSETSEEISLD